MRKLMVICLAVAALASVSAAEASSLTWLTRSIAHREAAARLRKIVNSTSDADYSELEPAQNCNRIRATVVDCGFNVVHGPHEETVCTGVIRVSIRGHYAYTTPLYPNERFCFPR